MSKQVRDYEEKLINEIGEEKFFSMKRLRKIFELDSLIKAFNA